MRGHASELWFTEAGTRVSCGARGCLFPSPTHDSNGLRVTNLPKAWLPIGSLSVPTCPDEGAGKEKQKRGKNRGFSWLAFVVPS